MLIQVHKPPSILCNNKARIYQMKLTLDAVEILITLLSST